MIVDSIYKQYIHMLEKYLECSANNNYVDKHNNVTIYALLYFWLIIYYSDMLMFVMATV